MDIYSKNIIGARFFSGSDFWRRRTALMWSLFFFLMLGIAGNTIFEAASGFDIGPSPPGETGDNSPGSSIVSHDYDDDFITASLAITNKPAENIQFLVTCAVLYAEGFDRNPHRPPCSGARP
jgi:hypothetical protein